MQNITPAQLAQWLADGDRSQPTLLDVREDWEVQTCHIAQSKNVPLGDVPARLTELDADAPIVCICHHGMRSARAAMFLEQQGFTQLFNLDGGIDAWARQVDPSMPTY